MERSANGWRTPSLALRLSVVGRISNPAQLAGLEIRPTRPAGSLSLLDRRVIGWVQEERVHLLDKHPVLLRRRLGGLPVRVVPERLPALVRGLLARVGEDVDQL